MEKDLPPRGGGWGYYGGTVNIYIYNNNITISYILSPRCEGARSHRQCHRWLWRRHCRRLNTFLEALALAVGLLSGRLSSVAHN